MESLKDSTCPFCGANYKFLIMEKEHNSNYRYIKCKRCLAKGPKSVNKDYAIIWWCTRK